MNYLIEQAYALLNEDIEAVKNLYPDIDEDDFNKLIGLDPTFKNNNSVGKYGKWILNLFDKGKLSTEEDIDKLPNLLSEFESKKRGFQNKDIGQFKSVSDLETALQDVGEIELSHSQLVRKNRKDKQKADLGKEAELVADVDGYEIWIPKTYATSCKLGQGTEWCTASTENDEYFKEYTESGNLYILINKTNPEEKYQFYFDELGGGTKAQFMDNKDKNVDIWEFFDKHKGIKEYFVKNNDYAEEIIENLEDMSDIDRRTIMAYMEVEACSLDEALEAYYRYVDNDYSSFEGNPSIQMVIDISKELEFNSNYKEVLGRALIEVYDIDEAFYSYTDIPEEILERDGYETSEDWLYDHDDEEIEKYIDYEQIGDYMLDSDWHIASNGIALRTY